MLEAPSRDTPIERVVLAAILLLGVVLRCAPLADTTPAQIVGGDALEYQRMAEFLLDTEQVPPGNRFLGLPLLLAALYTVLPFTHESILVATSLTFGVVALVLSWLLARRLLPPAASLVVTALVAVQPTLVANPHRGLSDEMAMAGLLGFLLLYLHLRELHLRERPAPSLWAYGGLGALGAAMALVRPDAAYAAIPAALAIAWRERTRGWPLAVGLALPVLVLPLAMSPLSQAWLVSAGVEPLEMRVGRAGLWMEFMMGRMPYSYAFYKETALREWVLGFHTIPELVDIAVRSTLRTGLGLGEAVWGQLVLACGLAGMWCYVRRTGDPALPLAVPFAILPQWGLVYLWPNPDVFRYSSRVVPILLCFVALGIWELAPHLRRWAPLAGRSAMQLRIGVIALLAVVGVAPLSVYQWAARPALDKLYVQRDQRRLVGDQHEQLVALWQRVARGERTPAQAVDEAEALRARHPDYAPTHLVLGVFEVQRQRYTAAQAHLQRAIELVPFFAEAVVWYAEVLVIRSDTEAAEQVLAEGVRYRPDYPLLPLLRGHLRAVHGDWAAAQGHYHEYQRLNRYQLERMRTRSTRILRRNGQHEQIAQVDAILDGLSDAERGRMTPSVWDYLGLDLDGLGFGVPTDAGLAYNLGLCAAHGGRLDEAARRWRAILADEPGHVPARTALGVLQAARGELDAARGTFEQLAQIDADAGRRQLQALDARAPDSDWALPQPQVLLPMTRLTLRAAPTP